MTFRMIKPKYETLKIYFDKENPSLLEIPQVTKYDFALTMYADRKVIFLEDHDNEKFTEIVLESDEQFRKRQKFEN